ERVVGGKHGGRVAAGEVDGAGVPRGRVGVLVFRRNGDAHWAAGDGGAGRRHHRQAARRIGADTDRIRAATDGPTNGVGGGDCPAARGLEGDGFRVGVHDALPSYEGVVGGHAGLVVGAREVDRAGVTRVRVSKLVLSPHTHTDRVA